MFEAVTKHIGRYRLVEKNDYCYVYEGRTRIATYCSIRDALYHKCEWFDEGDE